MDLGIRQAHVRTAVMDHYNSKFAVECERLRLYSPIEHTITSDCLQKYIAFGSTVADIGVGGGIYAVELASRDCYLHLVDLSERCIEATADALRANDLCERVLTAGQGSAVSMNHIENASCDAVLLLGPLYHLLWAEERIAAVDEAARVLKPGGMLFAAGINRLAYFRDLLRSFPARILEREEFHRSFLRDGNVSPDVAPEIGYAHLTTVAEFRNLFQGCFIEIELVGVESFAGGWQGSLVGLSRNVLDAWGRVIDQTSRTSEGLSASDHFLFIGRRRV